MTKKECAIVMARTGIVMLAGYDFSIFHEYIESLMGRKVFVHEIPDLEKEIKEKCSSDFIKLCVNAKDE